MTYLLRRPSPQVAKGPAMHGAAVQTGSGATQSIQTYPGVAITAASTIATSAINYVPGDTNGTAGGGYVAVAGNDSLSYAPEGNTSALSTVSLAALMGAYGDVRITYDPSRGGWWLASAMGANPGSVSSGAESSTLLASAQSLQGPWNVFVIADNSATNGAVSVNDQPKLGMDGNYLALSWQNYASPSGGEISEEIAVLPKWQVETANPPSALSVTIANFSALSPANNPAAPTIASSGSSIYAVYATGAVPITTVGSSVSFGQFIAFSGSGANAAGEDPTLVGTVAGEMAQPPVPANGAEQHYPLSTNDTRPLDALLHNGIIWWSSNMGCNFSGTLQACVAIQSAIIQGSTQAPNLSLASPDLLGSPTTSTAYGSIAFDSGGNLVVAASQSSPVEYPSAVAAVIPHGQPGLAIEPQVVGPGSGTYTGSVNAPGYSGGRWGDYSGVGVDPSNGQVWMATESMQGEATGGTYASNLARLSYSVPAAPAIASISATQGLPGSHVVVLGSGLQATQAVFFGSRSASFTHISPQKLLVTVPYGLLEGPTAISVLSTGGRSSPVPFTILLPPALVQLSPRDGSTSNTVMITGTDLAGTVAVHFGSTPAAFRILSSTQLRATVPNLGTIPETVPVTVTTHAGTSAPLSFSYQAQVLLPTASGYYFVGKSGDITGAGRPGQAITPAFPLTGGARANAGYWVVSTAGNVYGIDGAGWYGSAASLGLHNVVGMAAAPGGKGYWLLTSAGNVLNYGSAPWLGSPAAAGIHGRFVAISQVGGGYIVVGRAGNVYNFATPWQGAAIGRRPIVAATGGGAGGYYLTTSSGNVYNFGVPWHGSAAAAPLPSPVVGIVAEQGGYVLVTSAGNALNFGVPWQGAALHTGPIVGAF